ncbi:5-oxoprolinase subunit PxpB [Neptuniibacter sp. CAU 1671]|uniref:5-oxoprolinase subunit PxpB n=1 Tax=Neptuniibacter sp. CAU 1671 TaxID=3032593 RepID=UPI0023DAFA78|nr:5-oxoprolinase subunit PxpB [Neptuniibacter sp. CAU 1671]MDF2181989.1 5-oxoprolinase subunit PxpB [Neptuniibacter sp. CAU 1671]
MRYRVEVAGVDSLLLRFDLPAEQAAISVAACADQLKSRLGSSVIDLIPAYNSLLITYDLMQLDDPTIRQQIAAILDQYIPDTDQETGRRIKIPVCYEPEFAPDLAVISSQLSLPVADIIELHCTAEYEVQAVGFAPGFAYMGTLSERLLLPRKATPRVEVPAGSVAIAERQTAVYPQASPGGWWLIGRSPVTLFDAQSEPPGLLQVGDRVSFEPISAAELKRLQS